MRTSLAHAICALSLALLACACGTASDPVLGKWSTTDGSETLEIFADGKGLAAEKRGTAMAVTWQRVDERRLVLTMTLGIAASACVAGDAMQVRIEGSPSWYVRPKPDGSSTAMPDEAARKRCADVS